MLLFAHIFLLSLAFSFCGTAEKIGVPSKLQQPDTEDPLVAAVDLLESNWTLIQEVLQLNHHVLMQMIVGLWTKKKAEMPVDNLKKLAEAFDTLEDPVLAMKGQSVK
jgi:hypothetical protein